MFSLSQLSPITYIAFGVLGYVIYLYIRQRTEYNRYLYSQSVPQETQPAFQPQRPFGSLGAQTPTFSAQELEQRKPAKEIDTTSLKPRNLQNVPEFTGHQSIPSSFGPKQQSYESTEKMFGGGFKKNVSYEPIVKPAESTSSTLAQAGRSQPPAFYPSPQIKSRAFTQDVLHSLVSENVEPKIQQERSGRRPSADRIKEEGFIAPRKQSIGDQTNVPVDKYGSEFDLDREYKVFSQEFKQKEGKGFHDVKKLESPNRFGRGSMHSHFDRASHSPDSPFKFFENKGGKESEKRQKSEDQEASRGKRSTGDVKGELSTFARGRGRESAPSDLAKPSKIASKTDKRQKQIFMDVGSDDEDMMLIEKEKKQGVSHKRPAAESDSIDEIEGQSLRGKYFKDNNNQGKYNKPQENVRKGSTDQGSLSPSRMNESQGSSKRRSVADISYLSEYGANTSMRRYIEKKASQGYVEKPDRQSAASSLTQKYVNPLVPVKDISAGRHSFPQSQEPKKLEVPRPSFTSLIQPSQKSLGQAASPGLTSQKKAAPGGFLLTNEPRSPSRDLLAKKPEKKEIEEEKPIVTEKIVGVSKSLFSEAEHKIGARVVETKTEKIVEEKVVTAVLPKAETKPVEPATITGLLSRNLDKPIEAGSLFQQKPAETKKEEPVVKAPVVAESQQKLLETIVKETNSVIGKDFDIFKTVRPGTTFPGKTEEEGKSLFKENGEKYPGKEKNASPETELPKKSGFLFGAGSTATASDKKPEEETNKTEKEKDTKTEAKPLFGNGGFGGIGSGSSSGGLFANVAKNNSNPPAKSSEEESNNKNETSTTPGGFMSSFKPSSSSTPTTSQTPLFGGGAFLKREDSKNSGKTGLFGANKPADGEKSSQESAKGPTSLFQNKAPTATENGNSSPKKPGMNGGGLFANLPKTEGSGSLFGAKSTEESKPISGGGMFSNFIKDPAPSTVIGGGGLFANSVTNKSGGLFSNITKDTEQK